VQAFERERRTGTVADESLDARPVFTLDAHGSVDAEPTRALPGEHAGGNELVEESLATEVAEDALLDHRLHVGDAIGRQVMGPVKLDLAVVGLAEDAVEDDEVVMGVDVERGAEAMKEAYGSELGVRRRSWAGASELGSNRAEQDLKYSTGDANVPVEVRTQPLGDRKHPLPCGHVWQHVVGEVRCDLAHTPGPDRRRPAEDRAPARNRRGSHSTLAGPPRDYSWSHAAPEGGTIEVDTRLMHTGPPDGAADEQSTPHLVPTVKDSGTETEPTVLPRLFEPYFTTKGDRGTGLGLGNVWRIATDRGGHVAVDSQVGEGSVFSVYVPLAA